jgi:hypothetical protein
MTLRETYSSVKRRAAAILDDLKAGINHSPEAINWALRMLGEPVA